MAGSSYLETKLNGGGRGEGLIFFSNIESIKNKIAEINHLSEIHIGRGIFVIIVFILGAILDVVLRSISNVDNLMFKHLHLAVYQNRLHVYQSYYMGPILG